jgi:hypothetical protein
MELAEIGWEELGWVHFAEDRDQQWAVVNTVMIGTSSGCTKG